MRVVQAAECIGVCCSEFGQNKECKDVHSYVHSYEQQFQCREFQWAFLQPQQSERYRLQCIKRDNDSHHTYEFRVQAVTQAVGYGGQEQKNK